MAKSYRDPWGQNLRAFCTEAFLRNHIADNDERAKKQAENKALKRNTDYQRSEAQRRDEFAQRQQGHQQNVDNLRRQGGNANKIQRIEGMLQQQYQAEERIPCNTVISLDSKYARQLMAEVRQRRENGDYQDENAQMPVTQDAYYLYQRGSSDKAARPLGLRHFRYKVQLENGVYKIYHFDGVV